MPYITDGNERIVSFTIVGEISGEECTKVYEVNLVDKYKKIESTDISEEAQMYYGAEVKGYTCPSNGVDKWRIFYADERNVYLIADNYIDLEHSPKSINGKTLIKDSTYPNGLGLGNVVNDYTGGMKWIFGQTNGKDNSLAKEWLRDLYDYSETTTAEDGTEVVTYPNRELNLNTYRAIAYMLDTTAWGIYAGEYADYAIGGPPLLMYKNSYLQTHPTKIVNYEVKKRGYEFYDPRSTQCSVNGDYNNIYRKEGIKTYKRMGYYITATSANNYIYMFTADDYYKAVTTDKLWSETYAGFCPVVCLKEGVKLARTGPQEFTIVGME